MSNHRITQENLEVLAAGVGNARTTQKAVEALRTGTSTLRKTQQSFEVLISTIPHNRITQQVLEALTNVPISGSTVDRSLTNTLVLTQSAIGLKTANVNATNTLTLTQSAIKPIDVEAENSLTFTQAVDYLKFKSGVTSNILTLTQVVAGELDINRSTSQGLLLLQSVGLDITRAKSPNNTLNLLGIASGVSTKPAINTLTLTQQAVGQIVKRLSNLLVLTPLATRNVYYQRNAGNLIPITHTVSRLLSSRHNLTQTLSLTQTASGQSSKNVSHVVALTNTATAISSKLARDTLVLDHLATQRRTLGKVIEQTLFLTQDAQARKGVGIQVSQNLPLSQLARGQRVRFLTASNTLALQNDVVRTRFELANNQLISLSHSATYVKIASRTVQNVLTLTQVVGLSKTSVRTASNAIVFKEFFFKYTGFGFVAVPEAQGNKVERLTVLRSGELAITLPQPEFGDVESNDSRINVKRAMDGTTRIYKRTAPTSKLSYNFVIQRTKAIELRRFILAKNTDVIQLSNWKGEQWIVQMTNNPFGFSEIGYWEDDNKCTITLEFEGVRIS